MAVNFNGEVSICCIDWRYKTVIGDVNKESLVDIWLGPRMHEFRKMHVEMRRSENTVCRNCEYMHDTQESSNLDTVAKSDIKRLLMKPIA
jgi:radical SAM protein with 4Fe4S-binding SPASM domain